MKSLKLVVNIDRTRVQNYLKDFSQDLNKAIKTEYHSSPEQKAVEKFQDKKSAFSPKFNQPKDKTSILFLITE